MADKNKKKAWGWFVNPNAGDVEKGNAMFNNAADVGSAPTSGGMGEDFESTDNIRGKKNMESINIREELNKRDMQSCKTDFVNMYESANLSEEKKIQLVKLLSENVSNKKLMEWFDEEDEVEYDSFGDDYEEFGDNKDVYSEVSWSKFNSLGQTMTLKDALDLWWNSVRIGDKGYFKSFENSYEDFEGNELDDNLLNRKIKLNDEFDEDSDGYPIVSAIFVDEPLKEEYFTPKEQEEYGVDEEGFSLDTYDTYHHCEWCGDITPDARKELNMGWLCPGCVDTLISRGERPVFDDYGAFESLKEGASELISNEEFFNTISKEVDGADIVLGWDKKYHTFDEWVTLLLNTYKDLEQDLLDLGDYEQAKANRETVITKLLKYTDAPKDLKESKETDKVVKRAKEVIGKLSDIGNASLEVEDVGALKRLRKEIDNLLGKKDLKEGIEEDLPDTLVINMSELDYDADEDDLSDVIGDYLSDRFGYCHFGFDIYDTDHMSGDIVVTNIEWDLSESLKEDVRDNRYNIKETEEEIFDILGVEPENYESSQHLLQQFRKLARKWDENNIWLRGDLGHYINGKIVDETEDLIVVDENPKGSHTNTNKEPLKQATFVIDDGPRYIGYDEEYSWNGWACPWFTKEESLKIAEWLNSYIVDTLTFDETKDAFKYVPQDDSGDIDYYIGADINTEDGVKHLYPIGNKSWTWDNVSNYDDIDDDMDDFYAVKKYDLD